YPWAVLMGCDLFDSSSYAKYAKRGDMMFSTGTKNLANIEHFSCQCPVCSSYTPDELKNEDEEARNRLIAEHNLWISFKEIEKIKQAIKEGNLWEMVERRVRAHPHLLESMESIYDWNLFLDYFEPRSRQKALFYTGSTTMKRPAIKRIQNYLVNEYEPPQDGPTIFLETEESKKPYHRFMEEAMNLLDGKKVNLLVSTPIGPVPLELDEIYPIAQSVFPDYVQSEIELDDYLENKDISEIHWWKGEETLEKIPDEEGMSFDEMMIYSVSEYQFCKGAGEVLTDGELSYVKNRKGRIRNVMLDGEHILSRRHYDGFFTLKKAGAELLKEAFEYPILRTQVTEDSAEYNSQGHNVFAKFVTDMWDNLREGDETLVVDEEDNLAATARTFLTKKEIEVFDTGLSARTREGFKEYKK
ncbi:MAG: tRNA-guanine transglycosylase, partial [Thermoplasmatota archaeon]